VRSILADTLEPESFQLNQNHNKDLGQHQLNWPGECFLLFVWMFPYFLFRKICVPYGSIYFCGNMGTCCGYILQEFLFLNFFPNINFEEKFYSDKKGKFLSKHSKITLKLFLEKWMIAIALFYFSKLFQPSCEAVSNISLLKISSPTRFEGIFYSDRRGSFFQITQKNIETQNEWVSVFYVI